MSDYEDLGLLNCPDSPIEGNLDSSTIVAGARGRIEYLEELRDRLALYDEPARDSRARREPTHSQGGGTIFIVHGHREAPKLAVARYLQSVTDLKPAILHELPKSGRAIIEGLEQAAADAVFAVVLLTGDDEGGVRHSGGGACGRVRTSYSNLVCLSVCSDATKWLYCMSRVWSFRPT